MNLNEIECLSYSQKESLIKYGYNSISHHIGSMLCAFFTKGKCYTTISGDKWRAQKCVRIKLQYILKILNEHYVIGNDAPRGGLTGNYLIRITTRKVLIENIQYCRKEMIKKSKQ